MSHDSPPQRQVAFKVSPQLATLLERLPNKSAFIRQAILAALEVHCPLCGGEGLVPPGILEHFTPLLERASRKPCNNCGRDQVLSWRLERLAEEDRCRTEQFFQGGPFYCPDCYRIATPCEPSGWRIVAGLPGTPIADPEGQEAV